MSCNVISSFPIVDDAAMDTIGEPHGCSGAISSFNDMTISTDEHWGKGASIHRDARTSGMLDTSDFGPEVFESAGGMPALREAMEDEVKVLPKEYSMRELLLDHTQGGGNRAPPPDEPFYIVDLTTVLGKVARWRELLPRVKPFYAIKCNPDPTILQLLAMAGCGFDCASQVEIGMALSLPGVNAGRVIYANPCKQRSMLRYAADNNVGLMTVDNSAELTKIAASFPDARLILRIAVDDSKSVCRFNSKFGAGEAEWRPLLNKAVSLGLNVVGVSFHVGSGCTEPSPFATAVESARKVFDMAKAEHGLELSILDCGGGFPGTDGAMLSFCDIATVLAEALDEHFPAGCGVDIIAEPGRYMVSASHTYAVSVIGKRELSAEQLCDAAAIETFGAPANAPEYDDDTTSSSSFCTTSDSSSSQVCNLNNLPISSSGGDPNVALYINDGVYGSFNCVVFDHAVLNAIPLLPSGGARRPTKLFGPTCDSIDVVMPSAELPTMRVGDWMYFEAMGGYTRCASSRFNGQGAYAIHYVWSGDAR